MNLRIGMLAASVSVVALSCGWLSTGCTPSSNAVVTEQPAPPYVEEGATVNGTVVTAPAQVDDYVTTGGAWYYWHPSLNVWVHANHGAEWKPPGGATVYHHWADHPKYHHG